MTFHPDHAHVLAAWTLRHARNGIASAVLDGPETGHDAGLPLSVTVYLVEQPGTPAYLLQMGALGWGVWCCGWERELGTAPDLLGALWLIREDHQDTRAVA